MQSVEEPCHKPPNHFMHMHSVKNHTTKLYIQTSKSLNEDAVCEQTMPLSDVSKNNM